MHRYKVVCVNMVVNKRFYDIGHMIRERIEPSRIEFKPVTVNELLLEVQNSSSNSKEKCPIMWKADLLSC